MRFHGSVSTCPKDHERLNFPDASETHSELGLVIDNSTYRMKLINAIRHPIKKKKRREREIIFC